MRNNTELKPCPFCGGKPMLMDFVHRWFFRKPKVYYHIQCSCCGMRSTLEEDERIAIVKWNRRATDEKV